MEFQGKPPAVWRNEFVTQEVANFREQSKATSLPSDIERLVQRIIVHHINQLIIRSVNPVLREQIIDDNGQLTADWKNSLYRLIDFSHQNVELGPARRYLFAEGGEGLSANLFTSSVQGSNVVPAFLTVGALTQEELDHLWQYFDLPIERMKVMQSGQNDRSLLPCLRDITADYFKLSDEFIHLLICNYVDFICEHNLSVLLLGEGQEVSDVKEIPLDGYAFHWRRLGMQQYIVALQAGIATGKDIDRNKVLQIIKSFFGDNSLISDTFDKQQFVRFIQELYVDDFLGAVRFLQEIGLNTEAVQCLKNYTIGKFGSDEAMEHLGFFNVEQYRQLLLHAVTTDEYSGEFYGVLGDRARAVLHNVLLVDVNSKELKALMAMCFGDIDFVRSIVCDGTIAGVDYGLDSDADAELSQVRIIIKHFANEFDRREHVDVEDIGALGAILTYFVDCQSTNTTVRLEESTCEKLARQFIYADHTEALKLLIDSYKDSFPARSLNTLFFRAVLSNNKHALLYFADLGVRPIFPAYMGRIFPEEDITGYEPIYQLYLRANDIVFTISRQLPSGAFPSDHSNMCIRAIYKALLNNYVDDPNLSLELLQQDFGERNQSLVVAPVIAEIASTIINVTPVERRSYCCDLLPVNPRYAFDKDTVFNEVDRYLRLKRAQSLVTSNPEIQSQVLHDGVIGSSRMSEVIMRGVTEA